MEKLLLIGLLTSLPLAAFCSVATLTGNKILGFFLLKLPSIIILFTLMLYFLKINKVI